MGFNEQDSHESAEVSTSAGGTGRRTGDSAGDRRRRLLNWSAVTASVLALALAVYCVHDALATRAGRGRPSSWPTGAAATIWCWSRT
ncbi:hypothetical protein GXW82_16045 [Streptacidiphilus sp. 4-A2]|nr:hypothetical protein [Streptacidiphilus sp. 4-A2]